MKHYDYIFAGTGLAALMTLYKMSVSGQFTHKSILLIDPDNKETNDRTWCFWENGTGTWDDITSVQWDYAAFKNNAFNRKMALSPYRYKMVRGLDFYEKVQRQLSAFPNITRVKEAVASFSDKGQHVEVCTDKATYTAAKLFSSIFKKPETTRYPFLSQHFIGWKVRTEQPVFDPGIPVFMDFSVAQRGNTRFMYVLPFSDKEALVEYTLFSKDLLPTAEYETAIRDYLANLGTGYEILETERGNIPMTTYPFWKSNTENILHIGSAGGWTKASTGYTFHMSDKLSDRLLSFLQGKANFRLFHQSGRFAFYDSLLLDILYRQNEKGSAIFSAIFKKGDPTTVFKFLDEETSFPEDLTILLKCPKWVFIKALFRQWIIKN